MRFAVNVPMLLLLFFTIALAVLTSPVVSFVVVNHPLHYNHYHTQHNNQVNHHHHHQPFKTPPVTRLLETRYPWEGPLRDAAIQKYAAEETLLKLHVKVLHGNASPHSVQDDVIPRVTKFVQTFPFAAVLPVQPLQYLPTSDGVDVTFLRKKTKEKGSVDGGMRFFIVANDSGDGLEIIVKRNSEGQTCAKIFAEKLVVQAFWQAFSGNDVEGKYTSPDKPPPTLDLVTVESVFHKWIF